MANATETATKAAETTPVGFSHQFAEVVTAVVALTWPVILALVLWRLFPAIRNIIESRGFSIKVAGMEISVQDATDKLREQIGDLQEQVLALKGAQPVASAAITKPADQPALPPPGTSVLWVDDRPSGNAFEIAQLRNWGVDVVTAMTTQGGLAAVHNQSFDAIISDMGRTEAGQYNGKAGIDLVNQLRKDGINTPFIVYTTAKYAQRHSEQIIAAGGERAISSQVELLEWLRQHIKGNAA